MVKGVRRTSIYDEIGWTGLLNVVWNSTPYPLRVFALPYGMHVYGSFLKGSSNLQQLLGIHAREYMSSKLFRLFRPRYRRVSRVLRAYGIDA
ncbi:MAG: hypothetical protein ACYSYV_04250 [Planctomycetota bacterium]|jgi:hypothetical protein